MKRWHMIIDVEKCENCNNCFLSCKDEHCNNDWPGYAAPQPLHGQRWMNIRRKERGRFPVIDVAYRPTPCMHCGHPPCQEAAVDDAVIKRPDGIVLIDPQKAKGQKALLKACPYGAIWWNEELQISQKCTFCAHLLDSGWKQPRCVQACPTGALSVRLVEVKEMQKQAHDQQLEVIQHGRSSTHPSVYYRNLHRFQTCFIAGSIAREDGGHGECLAGARIMLYRNEALCAETVSDDFGDFKFDGLAPGSGGYHLQIQTPDGKRKKIQAVLEGAQSFSVGTVWM